MTTKLAIIVLLCSVTIVIGADSVRRIGVDEEKTDNERNEGNIEYTNFFILLNLNF